MAASCIRVFADAAHIEHSKQRLAAAAPGIEALAAVLALAGNEVRLKMLFLLLDQQQLCVCDLAASVDVAEASVSQVLRVLRSAGVVENRREGRMVYYRLADGHVRMLLDVSREHARHEGQG